MPSDLELAEKHKYRNLDGEVCINVTGVTGLLDDDSKSAKMAGAAAKLTKLGENYRSIWNEKMQRGTRIHTACEAWLREEDAEVLESDQPFLDGLSAFFQERKPRALEIERIVLSSLGFGGRFDFIAEFDGMNTLVDVKTGRPYFIEHTLQLSAYRFSDGMAVYGGDGNLTRVESLPLIERAGCLYLSDSGEYQFREYPADEDAFQIFCYLLAVKRGIADLKRADVA